MPLNFYFTQFIRRCNVTLYVVLPANHSLKYVSLLLATVLLYIYADFLYGFSLPFFQDKVTSGLFVCGQVKVYSAFYWALKSVVRCEWGDSGHSFM